MDNNYTLNLADAFNSQSGCSSLFEQLALELRDLDRTVALLVLEGIHRLTIQLQTQNFTLTNDVIDNFRRILRQWRCESPLRESYAKKCVPKLLKCLTIFKSLNVPLYIGDKGHKIALSEFGDEIEDIHIDENTLLYYYTNTEQNQMGVNKCDSPTSKGYREYYLSYNKPAANDIWFGYPTTRNITKNSIDDDDIVKHVKLNDAFNPEQKNSGQNVNNFMSLIQDSHPLYSNEHTHCFQQLSSSLVNTYKDENLNAQFLWSKVNYSDKEISSDGQNSPACIGGEGVRMTTLSELGVSGMCQGEIIYVYNSNNDKANNSSDTNGADKEINSNTINSNKSKNSNINNNTDNIGNKNMSKSTKSSNDDDNNNNNDSKNTINQVYVILYATENTSDGEGLKGLKKPKNAILKKLFDTDCHVEIVILAPDRKRFNCESFSSLHRSRNKFAEIEVNVDTELKNINNAKSNQISEIERENDINNSQRLQLGKDPAVNTVLNGDNDSKDSEKSYCYDVLDTTIIDDEQTVVCNTKNKCERVFVDSINGTDNVGSKNNNSLSSSSSSNKLTHSGRLISDNCSKASGGKSCNSSSESITGRLRKHEDLNVRKNIPTAFIDVQKNVLDLVGAFTSFEACNLFFEQLTEKLRDVNETIGLLAVEGLFRLEKDVGELHDPEANPLPRKINGHICFAEGLIRLLCKWVCNFPTGSIPKHWWKIRYSLLVYRTLRVPLFVDSLFKVSVRGLREFKEQQLEEIEIDEKTSIYHVTHRAEAMSISAQSKFIASNRKNIMEGTWFSPGIKSNSIYGSKCFKTSLSLLGVTGLYQGEIVYYKDERNIILYATDDPGVDFKGLKKPTELFVKEEAKTLPVNKNRNPRPFVHVSIFVPRRFLPSPEKFHSAVSQEADVVHSPFCIRVCRRYRASCDELPWCFPTPLHSTQPFLPAPQHVRPTFYPNNFPSYPSQYSTQLYNHTSQLPLSSPSQKGFIHPYHSNPLQNYCSPIPIGPNYYTQTMHIPQAPLSFPRYQNQNMVRGPPSVPQHLQQQFFSNTIF